MSSLRNTTTPSAAENDLWIFRDGRKNLSGTRLLEELRASVERELRSSTKGGSRLDALIRAGELESALADSAHPAAAQLATLTDVLASAALAQDAIALSKSCRLLHSLELPETLTISPPEGFSYYALQPLSFAEFAVSAAPGNHPVAVIGIRSIGTTLSAVVAAALRRANRNAQRITVRPTGHPYDRRTQFTAEQTSWIRQNHDRDALFLIVDEGPGRSGSTFLSVAEALLPLGISSQRVLLIGSREPDPAALCAHDAANRWKRFRFLTATQSNGTRFSDHHYLGGGEWRRILLGEDSAWPACWLQMERLKFLSPDGRHFFKFEGLGRIGTAARQRSRQIADAAFGCAVEDAGDGFSCYAVPRGRPLSVGDISHSLLERIAEYCAFRNRDFQSATLVPDRLPEMLRFNTAQEFGFELECDLGVLQPRAPILADGRMQPHEWLITEQGLLFKTDASTHGDDHFFPGPTDIAWDLAGTAVEWNLHPDALEFLLSCFGSLTGDDPRPRLPVFLLAYAIFRMASCKMALSTVAGSPEEIRLIQAYEFYRHRSEQQLNSLRQPASPISRPVPGLLPLLEGNRA